MQYPSRGHGDGNLLASRKCVESRHELGIHLANDVWARLLSGYRVPYDPLRNLARREDVAAAWNELWNELHHQGNIGEASFAALPHLVRIHEARGLADWNTARRPWLARIEERA
jgi:hypothetical protein